MLANTFSHGMIRNYVVGFGTLFNNIKINRRASGGESASTIAVPLAYAPRQRFIERITEDYNLDKPVAMSLPRMSFELMSVNYSTERKLNTMQRYKRPDAASSNTGVKSLYSPVPYDFTFQLNIYINSIEDGTHIVEQILPYFTPEFTVTLKGATDLEIPMDLPIVLNAVNMEDSYEGGFDDRRIIIWTMDFTLKGNLYGPISESSVINKAFVNMNPTVDTSLTLNANNSEQIVTQPAMFANGSTTNVAAVSVPPNMINASSDFGISQRIFNVSDDPNFFRVWAFDNPDYGVVKFGAATGNTTVDRWEANEVNANGTIELSVYQSSLRHTMVKDNSVVDVNEHALIQIFANTADSFFESFYGTNYQVVELTYKVKETVAAGTAATISAQGEMRWLTTNSGEEDGFTTGQSQSSTARMYRADISAHPEDINVSSATGTYKLVWDMRDYARLWRSDWDERIITAIRFDIHAISYGDNENTVVTDIDSIKIYANTTSS